jgi:uncharacterized protein (DUF488 family)
MATAHKRGEINRMCPDTDTRFYTIGHSTRPLADFIALLTAHGITVLVDVRTLPRSRHNPQFNTETLAPALATARIQYRHKKELGGLRHARPDSENMGWRNKSFRGYADYMETPDFARALEEVMALVHAGERVALMCAEGAPFRCHRSLIADALVARGESVAEIGSRTRATLHKLTTFARVIDGRVGYPGGGPET